MNFWFRTESMYQDWAKKEKPRFVCGSKPNKNNRIWDGLERIDEWSI